MKLDKELENILKQHNTIQVFQESKSKDSVKKLKSLSIQVNLERLLVKPVQVLKL